MSRRNRRLLIGGLLALTAYNIHRLVLGSHSEDSHSLEHKPVSDPTAQARTQDRSGQSDHSLAAEVRAKMNEGLASGAGALGHSSGAQKVEGAEGALLSKFEAASGAFAIGTCTAARESATVGRPIP